MKNTCSGSGSGLTPNPSAWAAALTSFISVLCSAPRATMSCGSHHPVGKSRFTSATIERIGTVGWRAKYSDPCSPFSSPVTPRMRMERAGRLGSVANARAISIAAETPEASSPAPL